MTDKLLSGLVRMAVITSVLARLHSPVPHRVPHVPVLDPTDQRSLPGAASWWTRKGRPVRGGVERCWDRCLQAQLTLETAGKAENPARHRAKPEKLELGLKNKLLLSDRRVKGREAKTCAEGDGHYALKSFRIEASYEVDTVREFLGERGPRPNPKALSNTLRTFTLACSF